MTSSPHYNRYSDYSVGFQESPLGFCCVARKLPVSLPLQPAFAVCPTAVVLERWKAQLPAVLGNNAGGKATPSQEIHPTQHQNNALPTFPYQGDQIKVFSKYHVYFITKLMGVQEVELTTTSIMDMFVQKGYLFLGFFIKILQITLGFLSYRFYIVFC